MNSMSSVSQRPLPSSTPRIAHKVIELRPQNDTEAEAISKEYGLSLIPSKILAARGFKVGEELKNFLDPSLKEGIPDPSELKGLLDACILIRDCWKGKGRVALACDFDVDGLSGCSQLSHFLKSIGMECLVFVPDRFTDGYGLNKGIVKDAAASGCSLLITIDYGTSNNEELEFAHELGLKTIVIDHHHITRNDLPADVFINPHQDGCGFAGKVLSAAGLIWFLLIGLKKAISGASNIDVRDYLDLACLGTICDMVPLIGANRVIVTKGLELLKTTKRVGLKALKEVSGINNQVSCYDVGFALGPRINAAGRIVHGSMVIELLTTSDTQMAKKIAGDLNRLNIERQEVEASMKNEAMKLVTDQNSLPVGIVVAQRNFHTGVVGIVAQRLTEIYYRPAVVLGFDAEGFFRGSVRGIKGFNVIECLTALRELLIKYGGHEGAGGLSVEESRLDEFKKAFEEECARRLKGLSLEPVSQADTEIRLSNVTASLISELNLFAPCGIANPSPLVLISDLEVVDVHEIKNTHLKVILSNGRFFIPGLLWRHTSHPALVKGKKVNVAAKPERSTYRGVTELQLALQAVEEVV